MRGRPLLLGAGQARYIPGLTSFQPDLCESTRSVVYSGSLRYRAACTALVLHGVLLDVVFYASPRLYEEWRGAVQNVNGDKVLEAVEMFLPPVRVASGGVMWLQRYCHRVDSRFNKAGS